MFLSENTKKTIQNLRDEKSGCCMNTCKASICDAMSIIMFMHKMYASDMDKEALEGAISILSDYNELITELTKEK